MPHNFTCLDISQCMLNKTILHVAAKYLESDISGCLGQFLTLGTKASIWCGKHFKMTLMSTEESQEEEHASLFFQLLLDLLSFSAASFSALAKYPVPSDRVLMDIVENLEQLNITKDSITEIKLLIRIHPFGSEVLKVALAVLDAAIKICRVYSQSVNWVLCDARTEKDKSVVALLQLGEGALAIKVNVSDIILTLISLANESLRCAAEAWSSSLKETVSATDAKRTFLPVKFYLINAARISSQYPIQAFLVYKEITLCVLMISTFRVSLSKESLLKTASQMLGDLLEQTSFHLLNSLLNSAQVKWELKSEILDWLFIDESDPISLHGDTSSYYRTKAMDAVFSVSCEAMPRERILLLGRVALFVILLKSSLELEEDVRLGIIRKLGWLLDILVDEEVYSSILVLQIYIGGSGQTAELAWQPMFYSLLHALKTFMVGVSSSPTWREFESFLLENLFHPHFLCWENIMELWCFMVHHAEIDLVNDIIDKLCPLFKLVASSESLFIPGSAMRKMARSICMLLTCGAQSMVDQVYSFIVGDDRFQLSSVMHIALLMEGFPLNLLSDNYKSVATQRIITDYFGFIENFDDKSLRSCSSGVFEVPVFALSASLQSL
ncbi:hypothetical protein L1049_017587 [Liquidambar formosana]|uniref:Uncharacterized protein n=1 Tax=Liquidambar formosana TaxID=63359 RepID=A0AAP0S8Q4_LIQFO